MVLCGCGFGCRRPAFDESKCILYPVSVFHRASVFLLMCVLCVCLSAPRAQETVERYYYVMKYYVHADVTEISILIFGSDLVGVLAHHTHARYAAHTQTY